MAESIEEVRKLIDEIDLKIIELLNLRIELCKKIAMLKTLHNLPIKDEERERMVTERAGIFKEVFKEIIKICTKYEEGILKDEF